VAPVKQESIDPLMRKEEEEVVTDITITPKDIPKRGHAVVQVHLLPKIIGDIEWMR
jgi:hypothetical protein